jgi:predicted DNA-binding protein (UPF0251 family)
VLKFRLSGGDEEGSSWLIFTGPYTGGRSGQAVHVDPGRTRRSWPSLYGGGASIRACAAALGVSRDVIHATLKEAGITRRPRVHAARLPNMDQERLFALIADKGITKAATAMGISRQTLHKYLAELRHKSEK